MGRAPLRGALRQLSPLGVITVAIAAIAVGWFLPLFGVSLLAFLLVEAGISVVKNIRTHTKPVERQTY
ncbi:hypothetical protein [Mycobacterium sp. JS623]|uniref:hypothetical protein n=1 Tax=Mycobacterium sp. JS623 TaxID=212767 RepID=UPI00030F2866|nr:hypothetical protein [Mycobacterium sp. JS623]